MASHALRFISLAPDDVRYVGCAVSVYGREIFPSTHIRRFIGFWDSHHERN
jgi:hypothetical protein